MEAAKKLCNFKPQSEQHGNDKQKASMKKIINPYVGKTGYNCICCSPDNPVGLHLEFWEDGDDIVTAWSPNKNYQGWVDTLHGGVISMLMDEVAGWVVTRKLQTMGVTSRLDIRFRHPVSTNEEKVTVRGHIAEQKRNIVTIHLVLENAQGIVCDEADATYFTFGKEKAHEMGFCGCKVEEE